MDTSHHGVLAGVSNEADFRKPSHEQAISSEVPVKMEENGRYAAAYFIAAGMRTWGTVGNVPGTGLAGLKASSSW